MFRDLRRNVESFWYNFTWDDYFVLLNGPLTSVVSIVPLIGYLVIFSDAALKGLNFSELIGSETKTTFFLTPGARLKLVYFGLIFVSIARGIFLVRRPYVIKQGKNLKSYVAFGLENFTVYDFAQLNDRINTQGHNSIYGKYYTDDWNAFLEDARWSRSGNTENLSEVKKRQSRENVHSKEAKLRHDDLLRSMLTDNYYGGVRKRKVLLASLVVTATIGYTLIGIPSIDLFLRVVEVTIFG